VGIDIGGTFTDVVALDYVEGKLHSLKVLTTHGDPALGVAEGVARLIEACRIDPAEVSRVVHATTLFTNALIERRGSVTGLLTTEGFRDVLEIGHERKYDLYDLHIEAASPLVPRSLRAEMGARMDAKGRELAPVDEQAVRGAVARPVREAGGRYNQDSNAVWLAVHATLSGSGSAAENLAALDGRIGRLRRTR